MATDGAAAATAIAEAPAEAVPVTPPAEKHLILVDGSGYIFRAFHALPPMTNPAGVPVNAVFGFTQMISRFLTDHRGSHIAVVFDASRTTFRNELYPDYKAHRPEPPPELVPQFALIREATDALGVCKIEQEGFEADDMIAAYARAFEADRRARHHRLLRQGPDAARAPRRRDAGPDQAEADPRGGGRREVRRAAGEGGGRAGAGRRSHRQRAGRARHRREDRGAAHHRVRQRGGAARQRGEDQAAEAARGAAGEPRAGAGLEEAGGARRRRAAARAGREARGAAAGAGAAWRPSCAPRASAASSRAWASATRRATRAPAPGTAPWPRTRPPLPCPRWRRARPARRPTARTRPSPTWRRLQRWIAEARLDGVVGFDTETDSLDALRATLVGVSLATAPGRACYVPLRHGKARRHAGREAGAARPRARPWRRCARCSPTPAR